MGARRRLAAIGLIIIILILFIFLGYRLNWEWTGFQAKTLWEWLNLTGVLAIPVVVGLGTLWFTTQQGKSNDEENKDNQREAALQGYIDKMSELILDKNLRESSREDEARTIARVRTITILFQLDARRIGLVFAFLREAGLMSIESSDSIVSLGGAELYGINLSRANLSGTNLSVVNLNGANLSRAVLGGSNLSRASFVGANLSKVDCTEANLRGAILGNANLSNANFYKSDFGGASLGFANLSETSFVEANFKGANMHKANLRNALLARANLNGTDFTDADLTSSSFIDTNVTIEQLEKARSLEGVTMPDGSIHP